MSGDADTVHAQRMDAIYRYQKHIYDLSRKFFLLGRDGLINGLDVPHTGSVLEVGCGTGRNLLRAAKVYPAAELFGLDISREMLLVAQRNMSRSGRTAVLKQGDARSFAADELFAGRRFDRIFFSYSLSMIPDWQRAIAQARASLAPGGSIHIVDFGQQEKLPLWFRSALFGWLDKFHVEPRAALFETMRTLANEAGTVSRCTSLYRGYAWRSVLHTA